MTGQRLRVNIALPGEQQSGSEFSDDIGNSRRHSAGRGVAHAVEGEVFERILGFDKRGLANAWHAQ